MENAFAIENGHTESTHVRPQLYHKTCEDPVPESVTVQSLDTEMQQDNVWQWFPHSMVRIYIPKCIPADAVTWSIDNYPYL